MKQLLSILTLTCAALGAAATDYDACIRRALDAGAGLRADSLRLEAEAASVLADNVPEGPEAEFERLWGAGGADNRWSAGISQGFDWPGVYGARRDHARALSEASRAVGHAVAMDRALQVKLMILDVINARQRLAFFEQVEADVARIDSLTRRAFQLEAVTVLDVRKTGLALLDCRRETAAARATLASLGGSLIALGAVDAVDVDAWTEYPAQDTVVTPVDARQMPQYQAALARDRAARAELLAVRRGSLPGFSVGYRHAFEDGHHFNGLTVGVRLPSWSRAQRVRAAELEAQALTDDADVTLAEAFARECADRNSVEILREAVEAYRGLSDDNSYLALLRRAYDGGQLTVIDYIQEINLFRQSRLAYIDLDYQYRTALTRANRYRTVYFK